MVEMVYSLAENIANYVGPGRVTQVLAFGVGVTTGYVGGLVGEVRTDREETDFDDWSVYAALGVGAFAGLGGTALVQGVVESSEDYALDIGVEQYIAATTGTGLGMGAGALTAGGFREIRDYRSPD